MHEASASISALRVQASDRADRDQRGDEQMLQTAAQRSFVLEQLRVFLSRHRLLVSEQAFKVRGIRQSHEAGSEAYQRRGEHASFVQLVHCNASRG